MADTAETAVVDTPSPAPGAYASVTHDGVTVESNTETEAQIRASLEADSPTPKAEPKPAADETTERNADGTFKKVAKPRNDAQARIDQAIERQRTAERERDEARQKLSALEKPRQEPVKEPEPAKPTVAEWQKYKAMPDAPKLDQFETIEDYNFAVGLFVADKRADERESRQHQDQQTRTLDQGWYTRLNEARDKDPDGIASINPDTPLSAPMMHAIKESPVGVALLRHLSDNQDLAQRLSTLHPALVMRELGRLEARLEAASSPAPAPKAAPISKATPPIQPVKGSSHVADADEPGDEASDDEWLRWQQAHKSKAR